MVRPASARRGASNSALRIGGDSGRGCHVLLCVRSLGACGSSIARGLGTADVLLPGAALGTRAQRRCQTRRGPSVPLLPPLFSQRRRRWGPQRPTESSDPTQHAKGRTGDCPGPRKETTTRRTVTQGGGGAVEYW